jgi:hypothetical protein
MPTIAELAARAEMLARDDDEARAWLARMTPVRTVAGAQSRLALGLDDLERHLDEREAELADWWLVAEAEAEVEAHWHEWQRLCREEYWVPPISYGEFHDRAIHAAIWRAGERQRARAAAAVEKTEVMV